MARFWTRKNEDFEKDEATMQPEDFLYRVAKAREQNVKENPRIENNK